MKIILRNSSDMPIYEQIEEQLKSGIMNGEIPEGEQLPSIRMLAKDLRISVITTTRAYNDLVEQGYLTSVTGKGYFVARRNNELLRERMLSDMEQSFYQAIESGHNAGLSDEEIIEFLRRILNEQHS